MMDTDRYDQQARRAFLTAAPHVDVDWFCQAVLARETERNKEAAHRTGTKVRGRGLGWKIAVAAIGTMVVAAGVIAAIPSSRAAAGEFFAHVVNWHGTAELHLGYLPDHSNWSETYGTILEPAMTDADIAAIKEGKKPGVRVEQRLYQNGDRFLQVRAVTDSGEALPSGTTVQIHGRAGVLQTGLSGLLDLRAPDLAVEFLGADPQAAAMMTTTTAAPDSAGSVSTGLSESPADPSGDAHAQPVPYQNAIRLTWTVEDTRVEMLSNLPVAELIKVAEALILNAAPAPYKARATAADVWWSPLALTEPRRRLLQKLGHRLMKRRHLIGGNVPNDREIHPLILVDQDIPKSGDILPRDLRRPLAHFGREPLHRLADHLEVSKYGILSSLVP
jgi:hypothetical protein